jgi:hypothetical protein
MYCSQLLLSNSTCAAVTRLVRKLLEFEPKSSEQVPLLNSVGDNNDYALAKAIESRDADLMYLTIFHLQRHLNFQDLVSIFARFPRAKALFVAFCQHTDNEMLKAVYYSSGETVQGAQVLVHEAFDLKDHDGALNVIHLCGQASVMYGRVRDTFHARALEETQRLMQSVDTPASSHTAVDLLSPKSLRRVVKMLILEGRMKLAQKLRINFNMSECHFYWVKAAAFAEKHDWHNLELFANEKRSPIGYLPFVELCQQRGAPKPELSKYIAKLSDAHQRAELYTQAGLHDEAQDAAAHASNASKNFASKAAVYLEGLKLNST